MSTKVYGFKSTPMREQFKRERELLMRAVRRYTKQGYVVDSSVQIPSTERAGKRITKSYIEKLKSMRSTLSEHALQLSEEGEVLATAKQRTAERRGRYAQQRKAEKREARVEQALAEAARRTAAEDEARWQREDEERRAIDSGYADNYYASQRRIPTELPQYSKVVVRNVREQLEGFAGARNGVGAQSVINALDDAVDAYGYDAVATALEGMDLEESMRGIAYSIELAGAFIGKLYVALTGDPARAGEFESDGGYWPADDLFM